MLYLNSEENTRNEDVMSAIYYIADLCKGKDVKAIL